MGGSLVLSGTWFRFGMCGIAGSLQVDHPPAAILRRMVESLHHRGPDGKGFYADAGFFAGVCRLAINGLADGDQPLFDESGQVVLFYNGEIYNSRELRGDLEARGYRFRTHSDGEVICHLWHEHGADLFSRLNGMYAVAIWLRGPRQLLLARDGAGEKPLHYASLAHGGIAFASEIRALLCHPYVDPMIDRQAAWDMPTFLWTPEPTTMYRSVRALPAGHVLRTDGRHQTIQQVCPRLDGTGDLPEKAELTEAVRRRVTQAVEDRLMSEVPVGCFLSGGLDSSIVTTLASRSTPTLDTFCVGFGKSLDPRHGVADETGAARRLAGRLGTRHHTVTLTAETGRLLLEHLFKHSDEPFAVSSGLGVMAVAREAQRLGIKVVLSGDGGDELFGGYPWHLILPTLPNGPRGARPTREVSFQSVGLPWAERIRLIESYTLSERCWAFHYYASEKDKNYLFHPDFSGDLRTSLRWFGDPREEEWSPQLFLDHDRKFYLPNEMLRKLDRMTMAWSVESRAPLVAPTILELAPALRLELLVGDGQGKQVLRRAFSDLLPSDVLARPKQGFSVPIDRWLGGPWADLLERAVGPEGALGRHGWVRSDALWRARSLLSDPERSHGHTLLSFMALNAWLERSEASPTWNKP